LSRRVEVGIVHPDAWDKYELCKRQLSWYKVSKYRGRALLVASRQIEGCGLRPRILLRDTKFKPPRLPGKVERLKMIEQEGYRQRKPEEWENLEAEDSELHDRWLKIMGVRGTTYEELFITHCANHANFIKPSYFVMEEGELVPYSIDKTSHICSACLEFYNIIGEEFRKKLVVPCPGAVLFAGLAPNRYYEVVNL